MSAADIIAAAKARTINILTNASAQFARGNAVSVIFRSVDNDIEGAGQRLREWEILCTATGLSSASPRVNEHCTVDGSHYDIVHVDDTRVDDFVVITVRPMR